MNRIRAAIFSSTMLLAMSAFAWQYPGGSQPTQPQQPSQASPSQGATQPGQSSQQPGQAGQPAQQPQSSGQQPGGMPTIDDQVKVLAGELNLNVDQQAKLKTALEDQHNQAVNIIQDNSLQRADKVQKIHALRESTIAKVRSTLTTDEQKTKFDQMVQAQNDRMHQREQGQEQQQQTPPPPK